MTITTHTFETPMQISHCEIVGDIYSREKNNDTKVFIKLYCTNLNVITIEIDPYFFTEKGKIIKSGLRSLLNKKIVSISQENYMETLKCSPYYYDKGRYRAFFELVGYRDKLFFLKRDSNCYFNVLKIEVETGRSIKPAQNSQTVTQVSVTNPTCIF